jgi:indole-3-glycerol phosphate synthase
MNILDEIVAQKRIEVAKLEGVDASAEALQKRIEQFGPRRDFFGALAKPKRGAMALIAEVKKASPSAGVICPNFDPVRIAREYEQAGASCLSVLTDEKFFKGSLTYLRAIREAVGIPLLRKDFIIDARQIAEAIENGADAILLIVSILTDAQLASFLSLAESAGLTVLVEVHDEAELDRAVAAGARLIGVNNRDLKTFQVNLATTEQLAKRLADQNLLSDKLLVAESGIHSREHVKRLEACGARAILVGEALMRQGNIVQKANDLLGTA